MLAPSSAYACKTVDLGSRYSHKVHEHDSPGQEGVDVCRDGPFKQGTDPNHPSVPPVPCPDAGQSITLWVDENDIPKGAQIIDHTLSFPGGFCPNATLSQSFTANATKAPDGTDTHPKNLDDEVVQIVWTETGHGPSDGFIPEVLATVTYKDVLRPLKGYVSRVNTPDRIHALNGFQLFVHNPNEYPARFEERFSVPRLMHEKGLRTFDGTHCRYSAKDHNVTCEGTIPAGGHVEDYVDGTWHETGTGDAQSFIEGDTEDGALGISESNLCHFELKSL